MPLRSTIAAPSAALSRRVRRSSVPKALRRGHALSCLNGLAGDDVEAACEKALFAAPSTVASATSYVAARFALLADMVAYTKRGGGGINSVLLPLRRSLEADRFGFVAHTLAVADRCSSDHCEALALLDNPGQVRANLSGQTLERYLDHYLTVWAKPPEVPVADATSASTGAPGAPLAPPHKLVDIDFPSAASIPAISIMNPEPPGPPGAAAVAAATAGDPKAHEAPARAAPAHEASAPPGRRGRKQAAAPPAPPTPPTRQPRPQPRRRNRSSMSIRSGCRQASRAAPAAAAATAASVTPVPPGPVQLNPFQPSAAGERRGAARAMS